MNFIWDMGGVVVKWDPDGILESVPGALKEPENYKHHLFLHPDWLELDRGTIDRDEICQRCSERSGLSLSVLSDIMKAIPGHLSPIGKSLNLIKQNRSLEHRNYFLSNMPADTYEYLKDTYPFWDDFEEGIISAHCKMVKPEPDIFLKILKDFCLDPMESLFLDDSPANIETARSLNIPSILFEEKDAVFTLIEEISQLSKGLKRARSGSEDALSSLALASKNHWDYPPEYQAQWKKELTLKSEYLENNPVFMLEDEGIPKAFYSLVKYNNDVPYKGTILPAGWWLDHLFVHPDYIGKGLGRRLFRHMRLWADALDLGPVGILTDPHARGFYEKMQCRFVEEIPSSIPGRTIPYYVSG